MHVTISQPKSNELITTNRTENVLCVHVSSSYENSICHNIIVKGISSSSHPPPKYFPYYHYFLKNRNAPRGHTLLLCCPFIFFWKLSVLIQLFLETSHQGKIGVLLIGILRKTPFISKILPFLSSVHTLILAVNPPIIHTFNK